MPGLAAGRNILAMTPPHTTSKAPLVPDARSADGASPAVALRRYRIARLRLDSRVTGSADRFAHLKLSPAPAITGWTGCAARLKPVNASTGWSIN